MNLSTAPDLTPQPTNTLASVEVGSLVDNEVIFVEEMTGDVICWGEDDFAFHENGHGEPISLPKDLDLDLGDLKERERRSATIKIAVTGAVCKVVDIRLETA